jgi:hypothetical protein
MATIAAQAVLVLKANPPPSRLVSELESNAEYDMKRPGLCDCSGYWVTGSGAG